MHPECILGWNQGYIAHPRMTLCGTNGTSATCDEDWYVENTNHAPCDIYDNIFHMGLVGIGTKNPTWNFRTTINNGSDLSDPENPIYVDRNSLELRNYVGPNNNWGYAQLIRVDNPTTKALAVRNLNITGQDVFWINGNGTTFSQGGFITSDRRFKENIMKLESLDEMLFSLDGYRYNYKQQEKKQIGFMAQDVQKAFPELVHENEKGFLSVNYVGLIPVMTEVIKKQSEELENAKEEVESLKGELEGLQSQIDMINENLKAICNDDCGSVRFAESTDLNENYRIFPNPTSESFKIKSSNSEIREFKNVRIISESGKLVYEAEIVSADESFDIRNFVRGSYIVEILSNGMIEKVKVQIH